MIRKVKISVRLAILISMMVLLVFFTILSFYFGLNKIKSYYFNQLKTELFLTQKDKIKVGTHSVALTISNLVKGIENENLRIELIRNTIDAIKYEKDSSGYYFVYEGTVNIAHPDHQYHGQDLAHLKDINDTYFIQKAYENAKDGGGFNELIFKKPGKGDQPKIVYAESIPNTNYWIATGIYLDNVKESQEIIAGKINEMSISLLKKILIIIILTLLILALPFSIIVRRSIVKPLERAIKTTDEIAKGNLNVKLRDHFKDEIGIMNQSVNALIDKLNITAEFAGEIGKGNLEKEFDLLSDKDVLGKSLLEMRKNLKHATEQESIRKLEDHTQNWSTQGIAKFGEILRQNTDNMQEFAYHIISNLVKYIDGNQGGIFILNDDDKEDTFIELLGFYAYERRKYMEKRIDLGVGLIGRCVKEQKTIYLTDLPDDYITITSGVGQAVPNSLLIVPLKVNDKIYGVVELAGFNQFDDYVIKFVEEVGESIASTISTTKVNIRTNQLLEQSQQQSEEMAAQEEEMRQNMEELQATQEESGRRGVEMQGLLDALNTANLVIEYDLNGFITSVNGNYLNLIGKERDELIGRHQIDNLKLTNKQLKENKQFWNDLRNGIAKKETDRIELKNKPYIFVATYTPIMNEEGTPIKVLKIATDITEFSSN
jgi:PAS domain S-box-containing protein